jgi:hypothetical protein
MSDRLALLAATSTVCLLLAVSPCSRAQQQNQQPAGTTNANPTAGDNRNQASSATETIRGVIAGITAEGEVMFDYRTNKAVAAEASFLTVVGSPVKMEGDEATRNAADSNERRDASNRRRHNVYHVWLTPRTKICEGTAQGEKPAGGGETQRSQQKREVMLDNLEVGDHIEIQFTKNDDSGSTGSAHQTEQMRKKHGRHRTHVGFASEVTILPAKDAGSHGAQGEAKDKNPSQ